MGEGSEKRQAVLSREVGRQADNYGQAQREGEKGGE